MNMSWRQGVLFGVGIFVGLVVASVVMSARVMPEATAKAQPQAPATVQAMAAGASAGCTFDPVLPVAEKVDGTYFLPTDVGDKQLTDVGAYIAVGNDAAKQGRVRDAEVAYITACRIGNLAAGAQSVEVADAKFHLAKHYHTRGTAQEAQKYTDAAKEALQRAGALYSESVAGYGGKLGLTHEKTAQAAAGLAAIQVATAPIPPAVSVPRELLAERSAPDYGVAIVDTRSMGGPPARKKVEEDTSPDDRVQSPSASSQSQAVRVLNDPDPAPRMQVTPVLTAPTGAAGSPMDGD